MKVYLLYMEIVSEDGSSLESVLGVYRTQEGAEDAIVILKRDDVNRLDGGRFKNLYYVEEEEVR